jgi:hypothetical protein
VAGIDNLKKVNDAHGHLLGEYVVGEVISIIGEFHEEEGAKPPASAATSTRRFCQESSKMRPSRSRRRSDAASRNTPSSTAASRRIRPCLSAARPTQKTAKPAPL